MPESRPPIEAAGLSLADLAAAIEARGGPPPVDLWNPTHCGHSGMRIARDGTWYHEGGPIDRPAMVRLFSTVLRREPDGSHVLVTPVEKLEIDVDRTALRAVEMQGEGQGRKRRIALRLDSGMIFASDSRTNAGVDHINTDDLAALDAFLTARGQ